MKATKLDHGKAISIDLDSINQYLDKEKGELVQKLVSLYGEQMEAFISEGIAESLPELNEKAEELAKKKFKERYQETIDKLYLDAFQEAINQLANAKAKILRAEYMYKVRQENPDWNFK